MQIVYKNLKIEFLTDWHQYIFGSSELDRYDGYIRRSNSGPFNTKFNLLVDCKFSNLETSYPWPINIFEYL